MLLSKYKITKVKINVNDKYIIVKINKNKAGKCEYIVQLHYPSSRKKNNSCDRGGKNKTMLQNIK